jgi:hypothetical protein
LTPGFIFFFLALWDSFLELRIKLQRATITCNCLPTSAISDDDELRELIDESKRKKNKERIYILIFCIQDTKLFRKTLALLLAIENRRSSKRTRDDDEDEVNDNDSNNNETTEVFKTLSKRLKHGEQTIDDELHKTYERFVPER